MSTSFNQLPIIRNKYLLIPSRFYNLQLRVKAIKVIQLFVFTCHEQTGCYNELYYIIHNKYRIMQ